MKRSGTWVAEEKAARDLRNKEQMLQDKEQAIADRAEKIARLKALRLGDGSDTEDDNG